MPSSIGSLVCYATTTTHLKAAGQVYTQYDGPSPNRSRLVRQGSKLTYLSIEILHKFVHIPEDFPAKDMPTLSAAREMILKACEAAEDSERLTYYDPVHLSGHTICFTVYIRTDTGHLHVRHVIYRHGSVWPLSGSSLSTGLTRTAIPYMSTFVKRLAA